MPILEKITPRILILNLAFVFSIVISSVKIINDVDKNMYISDLRAYYGAAYIIKNHGTENLYNLNFQRSVQKQFDGNEEFHLLFLNTPITAAIFLPITYLSLRNANILLTIANTVLLFVSILGLCKLLKINYSWTSTLILFFPIMSALFQNQLSVIIFAVYVLIAVTLEKSAKLNGFMAGLLMLKPQHLLLMPLILLLHKNAENKLRFIIGVTTSVLIITALNISLYGKGVYKDYISFLNSRSSETIREEKVRGYNIYSLTEILEKKLSSNNTSRILIGIQVILYAIVALLIANNPKDISTHMSYAAILILGLTLNFHTKYADLVILCIPILILLNEVKHQKNDKLVIPSVLIILQLGKVFTPAFYIVETITTLACGYLVLLKKNQSPV